MPTGLVVATESEEKGTLSLAKGFCNFQKQSYFTALDGLRAISILLVLLHHAPKLSRNNFFWTLQENGRYGVGFFFVISGFLICTLLLREESANGRVDLWKFYGRRALRLLPLYYAVLFLQAILVFYLHQYTPENQQIFREKLPAYLFYFSNWLPTMTQGPFFCAWSLAVEEQFYLAFGLILFFCKRRTVIWVVTAALLLKAAVYLAFGPVDVRSQVWLVIFSYREPILLGVLASFALNSERRFEWFRRLFGSGWAAVSFGAAIVLGLSLHAMKHESAWDSQLLYLLMAALLIGLVMRPRVPVLGGRLLTHIGRISYGIYLLHMIVRSGHKRFPMGNDPLIAFLLTSSVTIIFAALVYRYFEQPIIRFYKKKFSSASAAETVTSAPGLSGVEVAGVTLVEPVRVEQPSLGNYRK